MHPSYWKHFIDDHMLVGRCITIPEKADAAGLGGDLQIYTAEQAREEAEEYYPGIAVAPDGFVPVAQCLNGSGDPYFINVRDGEGGPLYRIYHDAVAAESYDPAEAVAIVLPDYRHLVRYCDD
jgi:hypothetical protein